MTVNGNSLSFRVGICKEDTVPNALNMTRFATGNTNVNANTNPKKDKNDSGGNARNRGMFNPSIATK